MARRSYESRGKARRRGKMQFLVRLEQSKSWKGEEEGENAIFGSTGAEQVVERREGGGKCHFWFDWSRASRAKARRKGKMPFLVRLEQSKVLV